MKLVTLAIDSVDTLRAGCTTHFASLLLRRLAGVVKLADLPLLVRLNPAIPWKTRGNASIALRLYYEGSLEKLASEVSLLAEEYSGGKSYGLVVATGPVWRDGELREIYKRALTSIVPLDIVEEVLNKKNVLWIGGRGVVGAAASLASLNESDDYTFELIAYRRLELLSLERCVVEGSEAASLEAELPPCVFNNYDPLTGELTAAPRGYDPILAGFRGDCYEYLPLYSRILCETPDYWALFRSNQHTDVHAIPLDGRLHPYETGYIRGVVADHPEVREKSHTVVEIETREASIDVVFYRESYPLNKIAAMLSKGDEITVYGSLRPYKPRGRLVLACEKLRVERVNPRRISINPRCPSCGGRMDSTGRSGGFKCKRCGFTSMTLSKLEIEAGMNIAPGVYTVKPGRLRHLTAPPWRKPRGGFMIPIGELRVEDVVGDTPPLPRLNQIRV